MDEMFELLTHLDFGHGTQVFIDYALPVLCVLGVVRMLNVFKCMYHGYPSSCGTRPLCRGSLYAGDDHKRYLALGDRFSTRAAHAGCKTVNVVMRIVHHVAMLCQDRDCKATISVSR